MYVFTGTHTEVEMLLSGSHCVLLTKWQKCVSSAIHVGFSVTRVELALHCALLSQYVLELHTVDS